MELKEDGLGSPPKEVQEKFPAGGLGVSPSFLFLPPRMGDKGVDRSHLEEAKVSFAFTLPILQLVAAATTKRGPPRTEVDSHLRRNDTRRAGTEACRCRGAGETPAGGFGGVPQYLNLPPRMGDQGG